MRTRIAPTPSGPLHLGNAVNFLVTWALARSRGGEVLLRVDDADPQMDQPGFRAEIHDTLQWMEIAFTAELPSQRTRYDRYNLVLEEMRSKGLVFACDCSRSAIRANSLDGNYPGTCVNRNIPLDAPNVAWRFNVRGPLPYPVVRLRLGIPAYHVASLCDDVDNAITHVVRGQDLAPSTWVQREIAKQCSSVGGFCNVEVFHHGLVNSPEGRKLSKSRGAASLASLRGNGLTVLHIAEHALQLHLPPDLASIIQRRFNLH